MYNYYQIRDQVAGNIYIVKAKSPNNALSKFFKKIIIDDSSGYLYIHFTVSLVSKPMKVGK